MRFLEENGLLVQISRILKESDMPANKLWMAILPVDWYKNNLFSKYNVETKYQEIFSKRTLNHDILFAKRENPAHIYTTGLSPKNQIHRNNLSLTIRTAI